MNILQFGRNEFFNNNIRLYYHSTPNEYNSNAFSKLLYILNNEYKFDLLYFQYRLDIIEDFSEVLDVTKKIISILNLYNYHFNSCIYLKRRDLNHIKEYIKYICENIDKEKHFELFFDITECSQKELLEIYNICSLYNCKVVIHYIINNDVDINYYKSKNFWNLYNDFLYKDNIYCQNVSYRRYNDYSHWIRYYKDWLIWSFDFFKIKQKWHHLLWESESRYYNISMGEMLYKNISNFYGYECDCRNKSIYFSNNKIKFCDRDNNEIDILDKYAEEKINNSRTKIICSHDKCLLTLFVPKIKR